MKRRKRKLKKNIIKKLMVLLFLIVLLIVGGVFIYNKLLNKDGLNKYLSIKLNGDKEITINYNEEYEELGASAKYKDLDISKDIKTSSNLDLEKIGNYKITYTIKYKKAEKSIYRIIRVVDTTNPVITLNGKEEIIIYKDSKYNEQGAKAEDNYDGDLTSKLEITGSIDTSKIGNYVITYSVKDSSLNESKIERKIKVIEKEKEVNRDSNEDGIVGVTKKGYNIERKNGIYYIDGILIANKSYRLPSNYNPGSLLNVFNDNFKKMASDAKNEGVNLSVISGFRSYSRQETIYNNYVAKDGKVKADTYSARPGHSEHQTGLAADINSLSQSFENTKEGKWLNDNCYKYGFIIRYVKGKDDITGYMFEPWHIRYVGVDLATKLYNNGSWIALEEYFGIDSKYQ